MVFSKNGSIPYQILKTVLHRSVRQFEDGLRHPKMVQTQVLQQILQNSANSALFKEQKWTNIASLESFRKNIPIQDFEFYRPYVDQIAQGQHNILSKEPTTAFVETSGTMSLPKWIPVTPSWSRHIQKAQSLWTLGLLRDFPLIAKGDTWNIVSSDHSQQSASGVKVGANTGRMLNALPKIFQKRLATPAILQNIPNEELRQYANLRFALQSNVTVWSTANPSTILLYCRRLEEWQEYLAQDLKAGTLCQGPASQFNSDWQEQLQPLLRKMPVPHRWKAASIWPLSVVNCWKGGPAAFFAEQLPEALGGDIPVRDVGITASEGYFALPLHQDWNGGVLWNHGELLEFRGRCGTVFWSWELELGQQYELIISSLNGLLRYDLRDVVEVTGFVEKTPIIRFVGKVGRYLNAVGEKVSEEQLVLAVQKLSKQPRFFTGFIKMTERPFVEVVMEGLHMSAQQLDLFSQELDQALCAVSSEYDSKRKSHRLGTLQIHQVNTGTYSAFRQWRIQNGATEAQVKDCIVAKEREWAELWSIQSQLSAT